MSSPQLLAGGRKLPLGRLIGKGGEGKVYLINGDDSHAVKIYTGSDRSSREEKISAMVRAALNRQSSLAAFPVAVVHYHDGSFAGFTMKLISGYQPLHELYAPGSRKQHFPRADYRFLARAAANIARAFASVHQAGCVVGDVNHSGILVSNQATVALIDADSFQFAEGKRHYLCRVGVPEYTPPELQGKPLHGIVRTVDHDAFGLAVVIFQVLLMGRHPFVGAVRRGDIPPLHSNIEHFRYVYAEGRDVGMDQPPGTPALSDFSPSLAKLFERTFSKAGVGQRPVASEWAATLEQFESSLTQCADNALHHRPQDATECAWCEMEHQLGTFLFLPHIPNAPSAIPAADPGGTFNLEFIWAQIERVSDPTFEQLLPRIPLLSSAPSTAARKAKSLKINAKMLLGILLFFAASMVLLVAPRGWVVAVGIAFWSYTILKSGRARRIDCVPFQNEFLAAQNQCYRELEGWRRRIGIADAEDFQNQLAAAKLEYLALSNEERMLIEKYRSQRRERQMSSYLEGFDIGRAGIQGIGPAKLAALASFGIDTAADIIATRLQRVPGFGDALIGRLMQWRSEREARFVYNASENETDRREMARIYALTEARLSPLRIFLAGGPQGLEVRIRRVRSVVKKEDPVLLAAHQRLEQARADLIFLGVPVPTVDRPTKAPRVNAPVAPNYGSASAGVAKSSTALAKPNGSPSSSPPAPVSPPSRMVSAICPRCSSQMQPRLARKGRNSGQYFWGCSRFPSCKGTRPT